METKTGNSHFIVLSLFTFPAICSPVSSDWLVAMQSAGAEDETKFIVDQVSAIVEEAIEASLGDSEYLNMKVNTWINSIVEITLTSLAKLQKAFKYIVTCVILEVTFHMFFFL